MHLKGKSLEGGGQHNYYLIASHGSFNTIRNSELKYPVFFVISIICINFNISFSSRLFVKPLYCGMMLDQSMLLNRRRVDDEFMSAEERVSTI